MTKLTTGRRKEMPSQEFALPGKHFPINDVEHGRKALQMIGYASPAEQATIRRKVHARYPGIGKK